MDVPETQTTLDTRHRKKTNKTRNPIFYEQAAIHLLFYPVFACTLTWMEYICIG